MRAFCHAALGIIILLASGAPAADQQVNTPTLSPSPTPAQPTLPGSSENVIELKPGELPDYDALRFKEGLPVDFEQNYLQSIPILSVDTVTSGIIFPQVPATSKYARLDLPALINVALEGNFDLQNSNRNVLIARSSTRGSQADFIPFVDLVGDSRISGATDKNSAFTDPATGKAGTRTTESETFRNSGGIESGVRLPTGGQVTVDGNTARTDSEGRTRGFPESDSKQWDSNAEIRYIQPLLRGGGFDVGTADLRRTRLREMDTILGDQINRRNTLLDVISTYFQLLQTAKQLQVSADAIRERLRFLDETRVKYSVGRVDESEILRAETQYLSELETAVSRRAELDRQRDNLLILLGLPLETPVSFVDITDALAARGRVEIPLVSQAVSEAVNNRMELMREDLNVSLTEIDRRVAQNDVLPQLDLDGGYSRSDRDSELHNAVGMESSGWDAGLSLRVPLINIQRREAARRASLGLESAKTSRIALERDITRDVYSAHRSVLSTEAQLTLLKKNVEQARKTLSLINGRFEVGFATVTEVRLAQDDLFQAETRYNNTLLNYQIQLAQLYVAMGRPLIR